MSDDLIKRLGKSVWTLDQAEDRIEQLEREKARLDAGWSDENFRALDAGLKLAKAVGIAKDAIETMVSGPIFPRQEEKRLLKMLAELEEQ